MRRLIGLVVLTISFSFNHVAFAQGCSPDCKCRIWEVLDSGWSGSSTRPLADTNWTKHPGFAGEETILGYKTYRIRREGDGNYSEYYMCPELQGYPLKYIESNSRTKTVWEVTQIIPGEPNFDRTPDFPVSMRRFEEKSRP